MAGPEGFRELRVDGGVKDDASQQRISFANAQDNEVFAALHVTVFGVYAVVSTEADADDVALSEFFNVHGAVVIRGQDAWFRCGRCNQALPD